jgi:hypothetical protein
VILSHNLPPVRAVAPCPTFISLKSRSINMIIAMLHFADKRLFFSLFMLFAPLIINVHFFAGVIPRAGLPYNPCDKYRHEYRTKCLVLQQSPERPVIARPCL